MISETYNVENNNNKNKKLSIYFFILFGFTKFTYTIYSWYISITTFPSTQIYV